MNSKLGMLYVVATPIGNLEDITLRAIRILKEVDYIFCEDTRITQKLLNKYQKKIKSFTFNKYNEKKQTEKILALLKGGKNIALVSDAGTPSISDPGCELILAVVGEGINVVPIPGASALTSALSVCPIKFKDFYFAGFLPDKFSEREKLLLSFNKTIAPVVLYIAPHDLKKYVKEIYAQYPNINIFYARELTKIYEESWCGKIKDLIDLLEKKELKGEIVLVLDFQELNSEVPEINRNEIVNEMRKKIEEGKSLKEVSKIFANAYNCSSKDLYNLYLKNKG